MQGFLGSGSRGLLQQISLRVAFPLLAGEGYGVAMFRSNTLIG